MTYKRRPLLLASLALTIHFFQKVLRTRTKTQEMFLDSKNLFWRKQEQGQWENLFSGFG